MISLQLKAPPTDRSETGAGANKNGRSFPRLIYSRAVEFNAGKWLSR